MKLEELQASLEVHEMRLKMRNSEREKVSEQTLQAKIHQEIWEREGKVGGKILLMMRSQSRTQRITLIQSRHEQ